MSFWSALGKIASVAAAPFTGGASLSAIPVIDAIGAGTSQMAGNMAKDRGTAAQLQLDSQKQLETELLNRQQVEQSARNNELKNSIFASMLSQWHPAARPAGIPASPFANGIGDIGGQAAQFAAQDNLNRLRAGNQLPPMQWTDVMQYAKPSIWETLLGLGGAAATAYGKAADSSDNG